MDLWFIVLLTVDLVIMSGICYILMSRRTKVMRTLAVEPLGFDEKILRELKADLVSVKKLSSDLKSKNTDLEWFEKMLHDKSQKLDSIIKQAEDSARTVELICADTKADESYLKAQRLIKNGVRSEEVENCLGMLKGEVELISAINNYRV